jgi:hypothetical protein
MSLTPPRIFVPEEKDEADAAAAAAAVSSSPSNPPPKEEEKQQEQEELVVTVTVTKEEEPPEDSKDTLAALIFDDISALKSANLNANAKNSYAKYAGFAKTVATAWVDTDPSADPSNNDSHHEGAETASLSDIESATGHGDDASLGGGSRLSHHTDSSYDYGYTASQDQEAPFLVDQMSDASKGLLGALLGKDDDAAALMRARYTAPPDSTTAIAVSPSAEPVPEGAPGDPQDATPKPSDSTPPAEPAPKSPQT